MQCHHLVLYIGKFTQIFKFVVSILKIVRHYLVVWLNCLHFDPRRRSVDIASMYMVHASGKNSPDYLVPLT